MPSSAAAALTTTPPAHHPQQNIPTNNTTTTPQHTIINQHFEVGSTYISGPTEEQIGQEHHLS
eukprot:3332740-Ditylum_brightwellii.AAC.1